ncbi:3-oxoacyl-[acyl-carrier-protein] synthase III C-terminal domain-containing protein [uncultured Clostridium sp.]|uniref:3-oxoacyl-[acyl-carrier-protein] synthase III C-terminal domain-containing protein n=1 Tax=uncultured Clostridium sp. TaxID=59620 RepID=UPI0025FACD88|nr:3-oxoacyl-[acyl-carrier-protein] synthase III C-terminal domain-containing protein [uncultured Clostridium sp.]
MIYSLDYIYRYMSSNSDVNKVLLVGSDHITPQIDPNNELCYVEYGDAACAIIVERTTEDCKLLGTKVAVDSSVSDRVRFPKCGFSNIYDTPKEDIFTYWKPFKSSWLDGASENINSLLKNNNLKTSDISMYCFSQYCYSNIEYLREKMNISPEKSLFIGDVYGYTGTTSPFLVLYEAVKQKKVKRGDYIILWTVGAGTINIALLFKY